MATAVLTTIVKNIGADKAAAELALVGKSANTAGSQATKSMSAFGKASTLAYAAAGAAAVAFAATSVKAYMEHQKTAALTVQVIKSTGAAAGVTAKQVGDLATSLSRETGVLGSNVQATENLLLTFRDIKNEGSNKIFDQTTKAVLDMATALNHGAVPSMEDLHAAAIQIGKAMNSPIVGLTALRRVGVTFSESQVALIKHLASTNHLMEAQKIILDELNKEFGGASTVNTYERQIAKLKVSFNELQISAGKALMPALQGVMAALRTLMPLVALLAKNIVPIVGGFIAFKAAMFLPGLLFNIAVGLRAIGASSIAVGITNVVIALEEMGVAAGLTAAAGVGVLVGAWKEGQRVSHTAIDENNAMVKAYREGRIGLDAFSKSQQVQLLATKGAGDAAAYAAGRQREWLRSIQPKAEDDLAAAVHAATGETSMLADTAQRLADAHNAAALGALAQRNAELQLQGGLLGVQGAALSLKSAQAHLKEVEKDANATTLDRQNAVLSVLQAQEGLRGAVNSYLTDLKSGQITQAQAVAGIKAAGKEAGLTKGEVHDLIGSVGGLINKYAGVQKEVRTRAVFDAVDATAALNDFRNRIYTIPSSITVSPNIVGHSGGMVTQSGIFHAGGPVRMHSGGLGPGEVPAILQTGEFVMRRSAVQALGTRVLRALNSASRTGGGPVPAAAAGGDTYNFHNIADAAEIVRAIHRERVLEGI